MEIKLQKKEKNDFKQIVWYKKKKKKKKKYKMQQDCLRDCH